MKTIEELMRGKVPGSVKVTTEGWIPDAYIRPYFRCRDLWFGLDQKSEHAQIGNSPAIWKLYEPSIRKVKKWLCVRTNGIVGSCMIAEGQIDKEGWIKIPGTELELDE